MKQGQARRVNFQDGSCSGKPFLTVTGHFRPPTPDPVARKGLSEVRPQSQHVSDESESDEDENAGPAGEALRRPKTEISSTCAVD